MTYTFRPYHLIYMACFMFFTFVFSTGYACGFDGYCSDDKVIPQGIFRLVFIGVIVLYYGGKLLHWMVMSRYEKTFRIGKPKWGPEHPDWDHFMDFLKEKELKEKNK